MMKIENKVYKIDNMSVHFSHKDMTIRKAVVNAYAEIIGILPNPNPGSFNHSRPEKGIELRAYYMGTTPQGRDGEGTFIFTKVFMGVEEILDHGVAKFRSWGDLGGVSIYVKGTAFETMSLHCKEEVKS